jgi:hypothetical protein
MTDIDLNAARGEQTSHIIAGRDKGKHWRVKFKVDDLDSSEAEVAVKVPEDVYLISLSFFLSLFGRSVRTLGKEGFIRKYHFIGNEAILPQIETGVAEAMKTSVGLPTVR